LETKQPNCTQPKGQRKISKIKKNIYFEGNESEHAIPQNVGNVMIETVITWKYIA
jgi:hypothetical protein